MDESSPKNPVRVRLAPSPTGSMHIGTARTALFNWLFARQHEGGTFVLRIEDTDKERSKKEYEAELIDGLAWLGLSWDEGPDPAGGPDKGEYGPYRQSERTAIYRGYLKKLLENKEAYYCYCTKEDLEKDRQAQVAQGIPPRYSGRCRDLAEAPAGRAPEVIRFKVPEGKVEFNDLIRGTTSFDAALFGDQVIAKDLDSPLFNFAVVVDDALMRISHVIRGEEHLPNTPKQILIQRALGFPELTYAHIPLILNADRSKMSKRFGDVALASYRKRGYLPGAILNFVLLLGWHPKDDQEIFTPQEAVKKFTMDRVQQAGAIFNEEKLGWLNREYMRAMPIGELAALAKPFFANAGITVPAHADAVLEKAIALQLGRAKTLAEIAEASGFIFSLPAYEPSLLCWKDMQPSDAQASLAAAQGALASLDPSQFSKESLVAALAPLVEEKGRGTIYWPLRVALSGQAASPDPMEIMETIGKDESLARIAHALALLGK